MAQAGSCPLSLLVRALRVACYSACVACYSACVACYSACVAQCLGLSVRTGSNNHTLKRARTGSNNHTLKRACTGSNNHTLKRARTVVTTFTCSSSDPGPKLRRRPWTRMSTDTCQVTHVN